MNIDIDNDGVKETIGRYGNTNLIQLTSMAQEYIYQIYDNGIFNGSFGFDTNGRMAKATFLLIHDHNINEIYLVRLHTRCVALYDSSQIYREYPVKSSYSQDDDIFRVYIQLNSEGHVIESECNFHIKGKAATRQEIYDS